MGAVLGRVIARLLSRALERVARIEGVRVAAHENLAGQLVSSGFCQDFDPAIAQFVVFRGKRILIDANLADRSFGGKVSSRESVNVNLAAIWAGGRPGKSLKFGLQLIRIV